jgi:hypothetical protein
MSTRDTPVMDSSVYSHTGLKLIASTLRHLHGLPDDECRFTLSASLSSLPLTLSFVEDRTAL